MTALISANHWQIVLMINVAVEIKVKMIVRKVKLVCTYFYLREHCVELQIL